MKDCIKKFSLCISPSVLFIFLYFPNDYLIIFGSFMFFLILTINFPIIAYYMQMQPTYIEDLSYETEKINSNCYTYKNIFITIQQFFSSLAFAILVDYIFNKMKHTTLSLLELYGVLAGYFLMYQRLSNYFGTLLVNLIFTVKSMYNKEEENNNEHELEENPVKEIE